jgi:hypothetical protein
MAEKQIDEYQRYRELLSRVNKTTEELIDIFNDRNPLTIKEAADFLEVWLEREDRKK